MTSPAPIVDAAELSRRVARVFESLVILWDDPEFRVYSYHSPYDRRCRAATTVSEQAVLLARTGRPVRGTEDVEVRAVDRGRTRTDNVKELFSVSFSNDIYQQSSDLMRKQTAFRDQLTRLGEYIDQSPALRYRLHGIIGYKTFSPEALERLREEHRLDPTTELWISLSRVLAEALVDQDFDPTSRSAFDRWSATVDGVVSRLEQLAERPDYEYEVRIFLNGPAIDSAEDVLLGELSVRGEPVRVFLAYATDDLLDPLVDYTVVEGFNKVNTIVRYRTKVAVEADEVPYLQRYADAAEVAELFVDALRLVRCKEDIGVLALEIVELDSLTPGIRKTWADRYQAELARFQPRRFDFGAPSTVPLTDAELKRLRGAIYSLLGAQGSFKGLKYALRRFRSSVERYAPSDPERLLEYAIALEALYLNDIGTDRGELAYRLRIRIARFLASRFEERAEIFVTLRDLYDLRSRVAHGESLERLEAKDRRILEKVLDRGPEIVSASVLRILESPASSIPTRETGDFWRRVELGGIGGSRTNEHDGANRATGDDDAEQRNEADATERRG
jgi:hypothetical protein